MNKQYKPIHFKHAVYVILAFILVLPITMVISAQTQPDPIHSSTTDFLVSFPPNPFLKICAGSNQKLSTETTGEAWDANNTPMGTFTIITADDSHAIASLDSLTPTSSLKIHALSIQALGLSHIPFKVADDYTYFLINKGSNQNVKVNMKGELFHNNQKTALFTVIAVQPDHSYGLITQVVPNTKGQIPNSGKFLSLPAQIWKSTGLVNLSFKHLLMLLIGMIFVYLGIAKEYQPLLLVPVGFGIMIGNMPLPLHVFNSISVYMIDPSTTQYVLNTTGDSIFALLYYGVTSGLLPCLVFLGFGAITDFTAVLSNPKSVLIGAVAQVGIFVTFIGAACLGFAPAQSAAIGLIGGANGPAALFLAAKLAPYLLVPIVIATYIYMALVPIIQPVIMKGLTTKAERLIRMNPARKVGQKEKIWFPIIGLLMTCLLAPGAIPLLGMFFLGNLLKESGVTSRLAKTAANSVIDVCTILLGVAIGAATAAPVFLNQKAMYILILGFVAFVVATAAGVLFAKFLNLFTSEKINPLIGAAGVSVMPESVRVVNHVGLAADPANSLLGYAMGPNVAGIIASAIAAGVFLGIF